MSLRESNVYSLFLRLDAQNSNVEVSNKNRAIAKEILQYDLDDVIPAAIHFFGELNAVAVINTLRRLSNEKTEIDSLMDALVPRFVDTLRLFLEQNPNIPLEQVLELFIREVLINRRPQKPETFTESAPEDQSPVHTP